MKKIFGKKMVVAALLAGIFAGAPLMAQAHGPKPAPPHKAVSKAAPPPMNKPRAVALKPYNPPRSPARHKAVRPVYVAPPRVVYAPPVVVLPPAPPPPPPPPPAPRGYEWRMLGGNWLLVNLGGVVINLAW